jgi:type I restriction enzyme S subunit
MAVDGWIKAKLGEVCDIKIGGTPSRSVPKYWAEKNEDGNPWASIADLRNNPVISTKERITDVGADNSNVKLIPRGTNLMSFKLTLGRTTRAGVDLYTNEAIAAFIPTCSSLNTDYLYHILPKAADSGDQDQAVKGKTLNKAKLNNLIVDLPPLPEQKKIAEILGSVDEAIAKTEAVIVQTQRVKQGLLQTLLTRGIGHTKFKQTELGEIPESWEVIAGEKLFKLGGGHGPKDVDFNDHGEQLFLKVDDFNTLENVSGIVTSKLRFDKGNQKKRLNLYKKNTLVFPKRGAAIFKNRMQVLKAEATVDPNLMCLNPFGIDANFLREYMLNVGLYNYSDNSGVPQLNNKHLYPMLFPVPPLSEQKAITDVLSGVDNTLVSNTNKLAELKKLKKGLMTDLLSGRVRVNVDQLQEEAA